MKDTPYLENANLLKGINMTVQSTKRCRYLDENQGCVFYMELDTAEKDGPLTLIVWLVITFLAVAEFALSIYGAVRLIGG